MAAVWQPLLCPLQLKCASGELPILPSYTVHKEKWKKATLPIHVGGNCISSQLIKYLDEPYLTSNAEQPSTGSCGTPPYVKIIWVILTLSLQYFGATFTVSQRERIGVRIVLVSPQSCFLSYDSKISCKASLQTAVQEASPRLADTSPLNADLSLRDSLLTRCRVT